MKKIVLILGITLIALVSCEEKTVGDGPIVTQEVIIDDFKGIETYGNDYVNITYSEVQRITVTGHSNIIEKLELDVKEGVWQIELENGRYKNSELIINIEVPILNSVELDGSGGIQMSDFISDENVKVGVYGSGYVELYGNIGCENLEIDIEGSGRVHVLSNFEDLLNLNIDIEGSGNYDGFLNTVSNCDINVEGSGKCYVNVQNYLKVKIAGSAEVNYKGNPQIDSTITGSGKIIDYND